MGLSVFTPLNSAGLSGDGRKIFRLAMILLGMAFIAQIVLDLYFFPSAPIYYWLITIFGAFTWFVLPILSFSDNIDIRYLEKTSYVIFSLVTLSFIIVPWPQDMYMLPFSKVFLMSFFSILVFRHVFPFIIFGGITFYALGLFYGYDNDLSGLDQYILGGIVLVLFFAGFMVWYFQNRRTATYIQHALIEREGLYQIMVEGTNEALAMVDTEGKIQFANHHFIKLFGYEKEEIMGKRAYEFMVDNSDPELIQNRLEKRKRGISEVYEARQVTKSGEELWTLISASPYYGLDGRVKGTIAAITDLSPLRLAQEQLNERNDQMDMFIYKATHDIQGPLASVKGILNLALESGGDDLVQKYINMAITSADRLDNAVVDLLHVTRINNKELHIEQLAIKTILQEVIQSIGHCKDMEDSYIHFDLEGDLLVYSDKTALITIFQNLILNAIKYKKETQKDHQVHIWVTPLSNGVKVCIQDNGEGIREDIQSKIFNMFFRGNKYSKGTGLGLYLVKKSVEKLGGRISLESMYGEGTTFTVVVPSKRHKSFAEKAEFKLAE